MRNGRPRGRPGNGCVHRRSPDGAVQKRAEFRNRTGQGQRARARPDAALGRKSAPARGRVCAYVGCPPKDAMPMPRIVLAALVLLAIVAPAAAEEWGPPTADYSAVLNFADDR